MQKKDDNASCCLIFVITILAAFYFITGIGQFLVDFLQRVWGWAFFLTFVCIIVYFIILSIFSYRAVRKSRYYSLRCYPVEMEIAAVIPIPADLPERPGQETILPLYLLASLTNYGLRLAPHPPRPAWKWFPAENAARFSQLSDHHPGRLVIPTYSLQLYYRLVTHQGDLGYTTGPADAPGFSGDLPASLDDQALEIIIIYTSICDPKRLTLNIPRINPLKLRLVVLDPKGQEDPDGTVKFYKELWEIKKPVEPSQDDDDSWMYRSRPILPW